MGALVTVEGPAGIGKTGLLQHARAAAGVPVLAAHGAELEADFPFGVVRQLFEPALRRLTPQARSDALAGAAALAAPLVAPADATALRAPTDPTFAALHGLYWLTSNLGPLVLIIDDAHWADPPSLRFLAYLARRIADLPVVLIVGLRGDAAAPALAELRAVPHRVTLRPAALSQDAVARLIEAGLGAAPDAAFARACTEATGGTPFLVRELVAALDGVAPV